MRDHFVRIYRDHADAYDQLVQREDHEHNLIATVRALVPAEDVDIVEWGAGTGRLTRQLAPLARTLHAFDGSQAMLAVAEQRCAPEHADRVHFGVGLHHQIPRPDASADLAIEGWSFGHLAEDLPAEHGAAQAQRALEEMDRIVRPGGAQILIETLGTGKPTPQPPAAYLEDLYRYFEQQGFERRWCRTDYAFKSEDEARQLIEFFFGAPMLDALEPDSLVLPECTGVWHRLRA